MQTDFEDKVEALVDSATMYDVVEALATICHGKAEHLRSNWQDENAALAWERAANALNRVSLLNAIKVL